MEGGSGGAAPPLSRRCVSFCHTPVSQARHLRAMPYLRALAFVLAMSAAFIFLVPLQALARRCGWALQHWIQTGFCRAICATIGIRVEATGALPTPAPRFVVANHVSWTDIIALASLHPFVFLAKSEVAKWPALGFLARLQGTVFVNRGARGEIPRVNAALRDVLRKGRDLVVFPEGTSSDGTNVLRFNPAHFDALEKYDGEAAIAPVAILYADSEGPIDVGWYGEMTFLPHLWDLMKRGGARCHITFGEPVDLRGKDRKTLAIETETRVRDMLSAARGDQAARRSVPLKYSM
ncbi:1-acyl-sn-glycerol-3-phosphate acyltransferase [Methylocystis sp. ATCC 49242]|uniref:lysophospholipid acyltransferase family protein n=1 Tax=Methylocystis sp. ATCC 49242 TaxID=622637 RepID=UPI000310BB08|nr:lysophospholipid acyltransferase family protein [Methylocystis sp. ATCC 49242]